MNKPNSNRQKTHPFIGWGCIGFGSLILLEATGILPLDPASVHVPLSIFALCGLAILLCGGMILMGQKSKFNSLSAALVCICFTIIAGWTAVFAPSESIMGGLPYIHQEVNAILGRVVFGLGALMCSWISYYAFSLFLKGK